MSLSEEDLRKVVGRRLKSSRAAAGLRNEDVMRHLGHKGKTQLSLFENGQRLPPLSLAVSYCDLTGISMDYLCGRIDDPLSDFTEINRGVIIQSVRRQLTNNLGVMTEAITRQVVLSTHQREQDRADLIALVQEVKELRDAVSRFAERTEGFEDMPAGSPVLHRAGRAGKLAEKVEERHRQENAQRESILSVLDAESALCSADRGQGSLWNGGAG